MRLRDHTVFDVTCAGKMGALPSASHPHEPEISAAAAPEQSGASTPVLTGDTAEAQPPPGISPAFRISELHLLERSCVESELESNMGNAARSLVEEACSGAEPAHIPATDKIGSRLSAANTVYTVRK